MPNKIDDWEVELHGWPIRSLEEVLVQDVGINRREVEVVIEYMYRTLLSLYLVGSDQSAENNGRLQVLIEKFRDRIDILRLLECRVVMNRVDMAVSSAGRLELSNPLYRFSPASNSEDYSGQGIGGFSQLRTNLISQWYKPE